jgi:hypothetical protein
VLGLEEEPGLSGLAWQLEHNVLFMCDPAKAQRQISFQNIPLYMNSDHICSYLLLLPICPFYKKHYPIRNEREALVIPNPR